MPTGGMGAGGMLGANAGCRRRYSVSEMAPIPQKHTASATQKPMNGILVITRMMTTPRTTRRKNFQNSSLRPKIHWPTTPPTTTSGAISMMSHSINDEMPTKKKMMMAQAISEPMTPPNNASTPSPKQNPT